MRINTKTELRQPEKKRKATGDAGPKRDEQKIGTHLAAAHLQTLVLFLHLLTFRAAAQRGPRRHMQTNVKIYMLFYLFFVVAAGEI